MILGSHEHTIDSKGRLTLPSKWRADLPANVVITRGLEECLFIFPQDKFLESAKELERQAILLPEARSWTRYFYGMAEPVEIDGQGRILLPQALRDYAGLNGNVIVVGLLSRIEVWNPEKYKAINSQVESNAIVMSEKMGQLLLKASGVDQ